MSNLYQEASTTVSDLITQYKSAASDGLSFGEVLSLLMEATHGIVRVVEEHGSHTTSEEKKRCAVDAITEFYVEVIEPIDFPGPDYLYDRSIKTMIPLFVDWIVERLNDLGWGGQDN
jgi:hypothetical protein